METHESFKDMKQISPPIPDAMNEWLFAAKKEKLFAF